MLDLHCWYHTVDKSNHQFLHYLFLLVYHEWEDRSEYNLIHHLVHPLHTMDLFPGRTHYHHEIHENVVCLWSQLDNFAVLNGVPNFRCNHHMEMHYPNIEFGVHSDQLLEMLELGRK